MQWDRKTIAAVVVNNRPPAALGSPSNPFLIEAPAASDKGKRLNLWATQYYLETAEDVSDGLPLRALDGAAIGPVLERKKWCSAAMEGSVRVVSGKSAGKTFNYAGKTDEYRVNCSAYYDHPASGGVKFRVARGAHGDGVLSYILVPYRTIAVDSDYISYGSIIYIPQARGISIKQSNGSMLQHDGYFFAGDAGGLIKDNHIDVFTGDNKSNPFDFLKSDDSKTFEAWVITNPNISVKMRVLHTKK
jgi:3D (Asp-Asp-Asp) domain-containing protein